MIVTGAAIALDTSHSYSEQHQHSEFLQVWAPGESPPAAQGQAAAAQAQAFVDQAQASAANPFADFVAISTRGQLLAKYQQSQPLDMNSGMDSRARVNLMILESLYETITGRKLQVLAPNELAKSDATSVDLSGLGQPRVDVPLADAQVQSQGGLIYRRSDVYREQERLSFSAQGQVRTADGRVINIAAQLNLSREYIEQSSLEIRAGDALKMDPLVINFDGKGAELSQTKFAFDLDANGTAEQIASLRPGSGYLVLDRNGDGQINNGSELFGPQTGHGFAELAQYDEDGNGFIDEGDSVYHRLRIWAENEDGSRQLFALGDKQVGAIYLGHISTPFQLKDERNTSLGEIAASGIYLTEAGTSGWIQEVNLTL